MPELSGKTYDWTVKQLHPAQNPCKPLHVLLAKSCITAQGEVTAANKHMEGRLIGTGAKTHQGRWLLLLSEGLLAAGLDAVLAADGWNAWLDGLLVALPLPCVGGPPKFHCHSGDCSGALPAIMKVKLVFGLSNPKTQRS